MRTEVTKSLGIHDDLQRLRDRMSAMGLRDNYLRAAVIDHCADAARHAPGIDLALTELDWDEGCVLVTLYRQPYPDFPPEPLPPVGVRA